MRCALFFALLTAPAAALTFENVSDRLPEAAHLAGVGGDRDDDSWSAVAADFDNDGWTNLFVANQTGDSRLYRNDGDGTFTNVTEAAGLAGIQGVPVAEADLDLGDAPAGVYLVRATSDGEVAMRPIVLTEYAAPRRRGPPPDAPPSGGGRTAETSRCGPPPSAR